MSPASLAPSVSIDLRAVASVPRGSSCPSFLACESVALPTRPISSERSVATADANPYEHSACQPQILLNLSDSKFRIVLRNVGTNDRGVDNLLGGCVGHHATEERPRTCAWIVFIDDT